MTDQKPTVTTQARLNSLSSSLITRGLALLGRMTEDRNLHMEVAPRKASPMWTFIGYGEQLSPDQRKGDQRPETQPVLPTSIPEELKERPQWVCWDWSWRKTASGRQHWAKPPLSAVTRGAALETDPRTWTSFDEAWNFANRFHLPGVGYVFLGDDPFAGIDIDHCRKPREGEIDREAVEIVSALHSYTEISPSGEGLHIIVRGKLADAGQRILIVDLTGGEPTEFSAQGVRAEQAAEAARILGVDRINLGVPDRFLADTFDLRLQVAALIRDHRPRWVYGIGDACVHPDHAAAWSGVRPKSTIGRRSS